MATALGRSWQPPVGEPVLSAGPKCKAGLFPDVPCRASRQRVPECPGAQGARTWAPRDRGALTMEHGPREGGVVMMTATAAGASSHRPWSLPGPGLPRSRRQRLPGRAISAAGSSHPRRACCFSHPGGGGTHRGQALRFAFSITSVGSAGGVLSVSTLHLVCRFSLWVYHRTGGPTPPPVLATCFPSTWTWTRGGREFPNHRRRNEPAF